VAQRSGSDLLSALTLSKANNSSQSLENANGNSPSAQDIHNIAADYGTSGYHQPYNSTTSVVWTLPFGRGKCGRLAGRGINTITPGEMVTFARSRGGLQVSGITNDFAGANNYRPNDVRSARQHESVTGWFNPACVDSDDPSQPFGNAPRNSVRTELLERRLRAQQAGADRLAKRSCSCGRSVQPVQPRELYGAER
jgi:hypothetical protein